LLPLGLLGRRRLFLRFWRALRLLRRAQMGFFAEAGPLQVFVSNYVRRPRCAGPPNRSAHGVAPLTRRAPRPTAQLIPEDMSFNAVDEPCYVSTDEMARALRCVACASPSAV
jgi:hypothetical protein